MKNTFLSLGFLLMGVGLVFIIIGLFKTWKKNQKLRIKDLFGLFFALGCITVLVIIYALENYI